VQAVAFHPQGKLVATASDDHTACLWDLEGTKKVTLQHDYSVNAVAFHPQGKLVATASDDKTACLVDLDGAKKVTMKHGNFGASSSISSTRQTGGNSIR